MIYLLLLGLAEARRKAAPVVVDEPNLMIPLVIAFCIILGTIALLPRKPSEGEKPLANVMITHITKSTGKHFGGSSSLFGGL